MATHMQLEPKMLEGRVVRLEPYAPDHREDLRRALDCDPESWNLFSSSGQGAHFDAWWDSALNSQAKGEQVAHAVRRLSDGEIVGTTSFLNIRREHRGVEIGATFYRPDARASAVNPACKRLLLGRAFDDGALRVDIVTDARNLRSQAAIAKLGAVHEGTLRRHKVTWTGHIRDTVVFAVTDLDWPAVRDGLDRRLASA
jgi:RimJ/RimL family protein N-acetyltransferase